MSELTTIAARAIRATLQTGRPWEPHPDELSAPLREPGACFVSLHRGRRLLGCIGSLEPQFPLGLDVARNAWASAFADPRVPAVTIDDYAVMEIEISVLGEHVPLTVLGYDALVALLRPGREGLLVDADGRRATFLPAVWRQVPTAEMFVDALWRKAGLPPRAWPSGTRVWAYGAEEHVDPGPRPPASG